MFNYRVQRIDWEDREAFLHVLVDTTSAQELATAHADNKYQRLMMASTTHELRTPLNVAQTALTVLEDRQQTEEDKRFVKMAQNSCTMLNSLIDDVLDMSRLESGAFELNLRPFDISDLMKEIKELFILPMEQKKLNLHVEVEEALRNVIGMSDRKRITQVLLNLISNALKFTFQGFISVSARKKDARTVEFEVNDTGVGITEEGQKNLFKLFGKLRESQ